MNIFKIWIEHLEDFLYMLLETYLSVFGDYDCEEYDDIEQGYYKKIK